MPTRRSRPARARKARSPEAPQTDVALLPKTDPVAALARSVDPSETGQLRALEAGWDELLA